MLLSGHHANIAGWRRVQSLRITERRRPDLYERVELTRQDRKLLVKISGGKPSAGRVRTGKERCAGARERAGGCAMTGTIVNAAAVVAGGALGLCLRRGLPSGCRMPRCRPAGWAWR